jgi:signal transduction histidine kinase
MKVVDGKVTASVQLGDLFRGRGIGDLRVDQEGALWVAGRVGVARIKGGRIVRFGRTSGMPCEGAYWTLSDEHRFWLYTPCGLVDIARGEMDAWGLAADQGANVGVKVRVLDQREGIGQPPNSGTVGTAEQSTTGGHAPKAARSSDGRIWLATQDGVAAVNPARIPINDVPPPVHAEQIVSDGEAYEARADLRLPPLQRDLRIDYTGLSLTLPESVQFRYRLEGRDADWRDAGNRRQAFYTDLPPGRYRFSVIAANNSGLWNRKGDTLEFSIAPAWWQTDLFRAACVCAVVIALYALYRLRVARLSRQFNLALEARVNERLRIARELHDTLLQTFQGLLLRLQTALQLWPKDEGRRVLAEGIDQAAEAITEGRDAVQGLRASSTENQDLADALRAQGEALATSPGGATVTFCVEVEGRTRELHPLVRDDIVRIAGEALRNAFGHARPTRVEVEIRYNERELRVRIRDDGKGMDASVTKRGREGHFGLRGMRERAKLIGGKLAFWSRPGAGTEVELSVPASLAYVATGELPPSDSIEERAGQDLGAVNR